MRHIKNIHDINIIMFSLEQLDLCYDLNTILYIMLLINLSILMLQSICFFDLNYKIDMTNDHLVRLMTDHLDADHLDDDKKADKLNSFFKDINSFYDSESDEYRERDESDETG